METKLAMMYMLVSVTHFASVMIEMMRYSRSHLASRLVCLRYFIILFFTSVVIENSVISTIPQLLLRFARLMGTMHCLAQKPIVAGCCCFV
jgi:hypothetical protein